jgi:hypothetical protein
LPTVSLFSGNVLGTMNWPSSVIRRGAAPPAPFETVSVASRRRGSVRSGVSVCDWRIMPPTIDGRYTAEPDRCAFVTAPVRTTFVPGAGGVGVTMLSIVTSSAFAPWSSWSSSPTTRPVVLARRSCVSPGAAAACSVVACVAHVATGPFVSIKSAIVL